MILIVAPYDLSETTMAALCVARLCIARGYDVRYITAEKILKPVDSFWDKRVIRFQNPRLPAYVKNAKKVVWFGYGSYLRYMIDAMTQQPTHVYVTPYSRMSFGEWEAALGADIVVGTKVARDRHVDIEERLSRKPAWQRRAWMHWDCGIPPEVSQRQSSGRKTRLLLYCDKSTFEFLDYFKSVALELWQRLSTTHTFTFVSFKSWGYYLRRLQLPPWVRYSAKFETVKQLGDTVAYLRQSDWLVMLNSYSDFGLIVDQALALGVPVIAPQIRPFLGNVKTCVNGHLVPCDEVSNQYGFMSASVLCFDMCDMIARKTTAANLADLQDRMLQMKERRLEAASCFVSNWKQILEG